MIGIQLSPSSLANSATSATTVGGRVSFPVTALAAAGSVRVTVSMADPGIANRTVTASLDITITGAPPAARLEWAPAEDISARRLGASSSIRVSLG